MHKFWGLLLAASLTPCVGLSMSFQKITGIDDVRIRRVAVSQTDPAFLAVASENTLYISEDKGNRFRKAATLMNERISHIFIFHDPDPVVYMAGTRHCYRVGKNIERIFTGLDEEEINYICRHEQYLYIATSKGLYFSEASTRDWTTVSGLKGMQVYSVEGFGGNIYLASDGGVFLYRPEGILRRLFVIRRDEEGENLQPRLVVTDTMTPSRLWLCTNRGVFYSSDRGENWSRFFISGAGKAAVNCLVQPLLQNDTFYLCTDAGFFKVKITDGSSEPVFDGLATSRINWMDFSGSGSIYLATARGLYISRPATTSRRVDLDDLMQGEPSIQQVQEAALHYNSANPERIESWRRRLKYRALLPRVSFDYDRTIGYSVSSSGKYFGTGPYDWGMTLSWDMGNLVWNSYEDDVDNRSRLTTLLRMDILDEVNRLYFERLRLKRELTALERFTEESSIKELRFHELTATLDGYTGGFFTREIESLSL